MRETTKIVAVILVLSAAAFSADKEVTFDSIPSGAQVELDGRVIGTTPLKWRFPGYYFGRKTLAWSSHASQPAQIRLMKDGYAPKVLTITQGPIHWRSFNGASEYDYFLISSTEFTVQLDSVQQFFPSMTASSTSSVAQPTAPQLSVEQVAQLAFPSVVMISTSKGSGSGFFISPEGVIATNAHVVKGESVATVVTSSGRPLQSTAIYVDQDRDLALVKVQTSDNPFLVLEGSPMPPGTEVVAIGSPAVGGVTLSNTVTKGVVSGIRHSDYGTWIQTDASINPGNSGGPLLDLQGKVVGLNTLKIIANGYSGLNFALSSSELASLLKSRFGYSQLHSPLEAATPANMPALKQADAPTQPAPTPAAVASQAASTTAIDQLGTVSITSNPDGAEIFIDSVGYGHAPAILKLPHGKHSIQLVRQGYKDWTSDLEVKENSIVNVTAKFEK